MGAIIIGIGLVVGAIGVVIGLIGVQSLAQPSGTALVIVGTVGFVGGLLLFALGFVHRALVDIGQKLDGVVHVEAEEYYEGEHRGGAGHGTAHEPLVSATLPAAAAFEPAPVAARHAEAEAVAARPAAFEPPAEPPAPVAEPAARGLSGALPSWFRRKRGPEPEAVEPEPEPASAFSEPAAESLELPPFELSELLEPEPLPEDSRPGAAEFKPPVLPKSPVEAKAADAPKAAPKPPSPPARDPKATELRMPERRPDEPKFVEARPAEPAATPASPEPPHAAIDADEGPGAPPAFLHVSDLAEEAPGEAPAITVLKAGVIGGMAYKLFSDGSIEAELPDGTLRFASLQDLRNHVSGANQG
ncbi:hypothetical protein [Ancylobacter defluvii]|uniref:DUF308 domain-containing protein n=1 Tax=Ancylobacter defluvii TaxID=1282440 RepID=A0A9W6NAX3_9HYPH|nr:hypothetical protein [Ancylobacter defluvii]MBS7589341.1 hypothetical protein [Ancylobacter defluvii]GLK84954.1 hypothetical protein GCM10017653_30240 [Ancylobacter defluvii]